MVRRGRHVGALRVEHIPIGRILTTRPDDVALVVLGGTLRAAEDELQTLDAAPVSASDIVSLEAVSTAICAVATIREI